MTNGNIKKLALSAMFTAVASAICIIASLFPTLSVSLVAIAGVSSAVLLAECGYKYSAISYIASSILVLLLAADKEIALIYVLMFGHYPMLKSLIERIKNPAICWALKIFAANFVFLLFFIIAGKILGILEFVGKGELILTAVLYNAVFILYDICLKRLLFLYITKIRKSGLR